MQLFSLYHLLFVLLLISRPSSSYSEFGAVRRSINSTPTLIPRLSSGLKALKATESISLVTSHSAAAARLQRRLGSQMGSIKKNMTAPAKKDRGTAGIYETGTLT